MAAMPAEPADAKGLGYTNSEMAPHDALPTSVSTCLHYKTGDANVHGRISTQSLIVGWGVPTIPSRHQRMQVDHTAMCKE